MDRGRTRRVPGRTTFSGDRGRARSARTDHGGIRSSFPRAGQVNLPGIKDEPRWITESTLLAIHAQQVERYGGLHGVRDNNVVLSALARPEHRRTYDRSADLTDLAAAYVVGFATTQGFNDGNKRTGLACALVFLSINGANLHVPPVELIALTMAVANGKEDETKAGSYFRKQLLK